MSIYLSVDGKPGTQIATSAGWSLLGDWFDSLDHEEYVEPVRLWEHGWSQRPVALRNQLLDAARETPPKDGAARKTLAGLVDLLRSIPKGTPVVVNNGISTGEQESVEERLVKKKIVNKKGKSQTVLVDPDKDKPAGKDSGGEIDSETHPKDVSPADVASRIKSAGKKAVDAVKAAAEKAYSVAGSLYIKAKEAGIDYDDIVDYPHEVVRNLLMKGQSLNDVISNNLGVGGYTACVIASHVLAKLFVKIRSKFSGAEGDEEAGSPEEVGELVSNVFQAVFDALGIEGLRVPDVSEVVRDLTGGSES